MNDFVLWLENHDKLAGWAQFGGAIIALAVTYFTAFAPHWKRKRQLLSASARLLANAYEAVESFHRTSEHFLPQAINLRAASLMMKSVVNEMNRFPIYELDDQGSRSRARNLVAVSATLEGTCLLLEDMAARLEKQIMSVEDRDFMRDWLKERLDSIHAILSGVELKRPDPPVFDNVANPA